MRVTRVIALVGLLAIVVAARSATLDPPPVWTNGTLIGPARQSAEFVKATFSYNAETQKLKFVLGDKWVEMTRGSTSARANGNAITLPVAPKVLNGTTYVPLKNLFVGLGLEVKPYGDTAWIICTGKTCTRLEVPPKPE
jgi:hypothetical protein